MVMDSIPMSQWPSDHRYAIPVAGDTDVVTVTIDDKVVQATRGELVIKVAQDHGVYIPRFCYHERMKPVGMCRMCLVEIEGMRGLQISCATPVTDGMVVRTRSEAVQQAQDGVLELLLVNHPLDCPVCDRGGECPLQDQALAFGPGESRYVEEKRHFAKPTPISDLVMLDRERCIQCGRCTRFAAEVAGEPLIDFGGRGGRTEVITYPGQPFNSYFSGNTVQICPVGALTARPYRFRARPWDLASVETSCTTCSVGCRAELDSTSNRLVRVLGVDSEPVNHGWLCDKGRFGYEWVHSERRVRTPLVRRGSELVESSWPDALDAAAAVLRRTLDEHGPGAIAVLGGAQGTNEDAYAWARFAKGVLCTDHVDAQLGDGLPADVVLGMPRATIADLDRAKSIVLLGSDLREELPVLHLRVRRAVVDLGVPLVDVGARDHGLTRYATAALRHPPGAPDEVLDKLVTALGGKKTRTVALDRLVDAMEGRDGPVVVILGRPSVAETATATVHAASKLVAIPGVRFLSALPRANVHGALDLGLAPGFLPGRVRLDAGRDAVTEAWGGVPADSGLDAARILAATARGDVRVLVLLDCDPLSDFPDRSLARAALGHADRVLCVGVFPDGAATRADVVLPPTVWGEQAGTMTNLEGRVLRLGRRITPAGATMEGWRIAGELAARLGFDFDLETVEEVQDEIARVAPAFAGVDSAMLRQTTDGVVLPPHERAAEAASPPVALHVWDRQAAAAVPVPVDAYALRLVAARTLYGSDRVTAASPSLARLAEDGPRLLVNARDRERIGVDDGVVVRVTSAGGSLELPLHADAATPVGVAFIAVNRAGAGAFDLIGIDDPVTELRVETIS